VGLVLLACALGATGAMVGRAQHAKPVELTLQGVVRVQGGQAVAVLAEKNGARRLPVAVTRAEAALMQLGNRHGLVSSSLEALGGHVKRVDIDSVGASGSLHARLVLEAGAGEVQVDASAGEALALAIQSGAKVTVDADVLDEAGISLDDLRGKAVNTRRREVEPAPVFDI
jgi:bifunctional DNase/RNase